MADEDAGKHSLFVTSSGQNGPPLFARMLFLEDLEPREASLQMAVDRILLEITLLPILRIYRWLEPCVTIGYFESIADAELRFPRVPIVRRWTGGGAVLHGTDAPYSLIVPRSEPLASVRPSESYRLIHGALAKALREDIPEVCAAKESKAKQSNLCFENPVADDLVLGNCKVAGAGQRRTRLGLLHQGSIQIGGSNFHRARNFASILSGEVQSILLPDGLIQKAKGGPL
jgi:lipoate-protein ligase A